MSIISAVLFLVLISSGSIFCSAYFNKRYEEVLPITCVTMIAIAFVFGIIGILKFSTLIICLLGIVLFVLGVIKAIKNKQIHALLVNTFTPGFFVFIIFVGIMFLGVYGKVFDTNDEFSHWGDIVKVMAILDDFGTNPASHSTFKTYPPAMSLFQYLAVKLNTMITKESFSEWLCYFSYDVLAAAMLIPVCKKMTFKKCLAPIAILATIYLLPFGFYAYSYYSVYIDEFLGILIAAGAITLLWNEENDFWFVLMMCSVMFMLTLSKDAGLLFAAFFAIALIILTLLKSRERVFCKQNIIRAFVYFCSIAIPKVLWNINIKINHANAVFSNKIDFVSLINVLLGKEESYRVRVLRNYVTEFIVGAKYIGATQIAINYICLTLLTIFFVFLLLSMINRKQKVNKINIKVTFGYLAVTLLCYLVGLCVIYMYKFSELEAVGLASFARYIYIIFLGEWMFITLSLIKYADEESEFRREVCGFAICFVFLATNLEAAGTFPTNAYAKASIVFREDYRDVVEKTLKYTTGDDQIWFIQQETSGEDGQQYNFCIRPNYINGYPSIGQYEDDEDKDITIPMTPEEWKKKLLDDDYDFVMLYDINGTFRSYFASCFENPEDMEDRTLFKINKETGMLSLCE